MSEETGPRSSDSQPNPSGEPQSPPGKVDPYAPTEEHEIGFALQTEFQKRFHGIPRLGPFMASHRHRAPLAEVAAWAVRYGHPKTTLSAALKAFFAHPNPRDAEFFRRRQYDFGTFLRQAASLAQAWFDAHPDENPHRLDPEDYDPRTADEPPRDDFEDAMWNDFAQRDPRHPWDVVTARQRHAHLLRRSA